MLIYYYAKWVIKYCVCDLEVCCRLFVCSWYRLQSFDYVWIVFHCDSFFDSLSLLDCRWFFNDCRFVVFQFLSLYLVMLTFGCFSYVLRAAIWLCFSLSWRIYFYFWVISFYFFKPLIVTFHSSIQSESYSSISGLTKVKVFFNFYLSNPLWMPITSIVLSLKKTGEPICPFSVWH
jgi:hypothetical protein